MLKFISEMANENIVYNMYDWAVLFYNFCKT